MAASNSLNEPLDAQWQRGGDDVAVEDADDDDSVPVIAEVVDDNIIFAKHCSSER